MRLHRRHKIFIGSLLGLALLLYAASFLISNIISKKVEALLRKQKIENFQVSIDKTRFSLFDRSLVFKDVHFKPGDSSMIELRQGTLGKNSLFKVSVSRLKFKGIHLTSLLFSRNLEINTLIIDDPLYQYFTKNTKQASENPQKSVRLDSIHLSELKGFQLNRIQVTNLKMQMIDLEEDKITFQNKPLNFEVTGAKLEAIAENYFKLTPLEDSFEMTRIRVEFPDIKYSFSIDELKYHFGGNNLQISNLKLKPLVNKLTLANSYIYNNEIYDLAIKDLKVFNPDLEKIIQNKGIYADSVYITQLSMEIYKDKRKPFDLKRRPKLPHQLLKQMKTPLLIHKLTLVDSDLTYEEKLEHKDVLMKASMTDIHMNMFNITSIQAHREVPLKIDLSTKLMGKAELKLDLLLPLADDQQTFFFSGYLGPSEMSFYDDAVIPAIGLKVLQGKIDGLSFQGSANNFYSSGTMVFLYEDFEAEVFKAKSAEKNNFLSWSVNNLIHKSNPGPNGETREALMNFERVLYKGFGNYLWKTLQNGIVNSIAPFGKTLEKADAKKKRQLKRELRRQKKEDS